MRRLPARWTRTATSPAVAIRDPLRELEARLLGRVQLLAALLGSGSIPPPLD